jgi:hypothetical protein
VAFGIGLSLDGKALNLEPDFTRFEFKDLDNPSAAAEIDTSTARIMYRFVYTWIAPAPLAPGEHKIEFFFNGGQTVVHTPRQQLKAVDAQGNPLPTDYDLALHAFPRLTANFTISQPPTGEPDTTPTEGQPPTAAPQGAQLPCWAVVAAGAAMALLGLGLGVRRLVYHKGNAVTAMLLALAGIAIVFGALERIGAIDAIRPAPAPKSAPSAWASPITASLG